MLQSAVVCTQPQRGASLRLESNEQPREEVLDRPLGEQADMVGCRARFAWVHEIALTGSLGGWAEKRGVSSKGAGCFFISIRLGEDLGYELTLGLLLAKFHG